MATAATTEPADRLPDGVQLWQQDGGWYLAVGDLRQGPFLYRPTLTEVWDQAGAGDGTESVVTRFTRFDAAGEQMTFRQDERIDPTGQRHLLRTLLVETPPSPEAYEGLELPTPGAASRQETPERR